MRACSSSKAAPDPSLENLLPHLTRNLGRQYPIDLVTCYGGLPAGFRPDTQSLPRNRLRVRPNSRKELVRELASRDYAYRRHDLLGRAHHDQVEMVARLARPGQVFHRQ